jgi:hypothetical protein
MMPEPLTASKPSQEVTPLIIEATWSATEFANIDLGDRRLDRRLIKLCADFAAQPQASIPQASEDWASTKAAYRFFENPKVTAARVLAPHQQQTCARMAAHSVVLAVQDTSYLNYTAHPSTQGLGLIGAERDGQMGLLMHSTLALTAEGVPLGLLTQQLWTREPVAPALDAEARRTLRRQSPIASKESLKWLTAVRQAQALCPAGVELVHVCDSEADIYEMFQEVQDLGTKMVIRASQDRAVMESGRMRTLLFQEPVRGYLDVEIPAQHARPARTARVEVRYGDLTLRPPYRAPGCQADLRPLTLSVVWAREIDAPADVDEPLEWLLVTNVPVHDIGDAVERIRWYRLRWHIEVFHKVLKSGCTIENCRLDTAAELIRYVTLNSVIAWRIVWMVQLNRVQPELACSLVLAAHEWQALYAAIHRTASLPTTLPTVRQVVRWIAKLGGFLGRKGDGEPGVTVLWRGWHRLHDLVTMWEVVHDTPSA